jgi:hypothetical protein
MCETCEGEIRTRIATAWDIIQWSRSWLAADFYRVRESSPRALCCKLVNTHAGPHFVHFIGTCDKRSINHNSLKRQRLWLGDHSTIARRNADLLTAPANLNLVRPDLPDSLIQLITLMLQKDPARRPSSWKVVIDRVQEGVGKRMWV